MPRPLEPLRDGEEYKMLSFRASAGDYQKICDEIARRESETGYVVTLQEIMQDLIREGL